MIDEAHKLVLEVREKTRNVCLMAIESLISDPQGLVLDIHTIEACANIVRNLGTTPTQVDAVSA